MTFPQPIPGEEHDKICFDLLALLPQERIVYFETNLSTGLMEELLAPMPNVETLRLSDPVVFEWFLLPDPNGPNAHKKLLPSLKWLYLEGAVVEDGNWDPLVRYLTHQTSSNDQTISLSVSGGGVHICTGVRVQIIGLVDSFRYSPDLDAYCPFDYCF